MKFIGFIPELDQQPQHLDSKPLEPLRSKARATQHIRVSIRITRSNIHLHTCTRYACIHVSAARNECMYTCIHPHIYKHTYVIRTHVCRCICICMCTYVRLCMCMYGHVCVCIHIYVCVGCTCVCVSLCACLCLSLSLSPFLLVCVHICTYMLTSIPLYPYVGM